MHADRRLRGDWGLPYQPGQAALDPPQQRRHLPPRRITYAISVSRCDRARLPRGTNVFARQPGKVPVSMAITAVSTLSEAASC